MGKTGNRLAALGFLAALTMLAVLPGTAAAASADPADPALAGSCEPTLRPVPGRALTLDAGAPVDLPGILTMGTGAGTVAGTGSPSAPADPGQNAPLLSLPLADTARTLGAGSLPAVGPLVTDEVCPGLQNEVNALSAATQSLLSGPPRVPAPRPAQPAPRPSAGSTPPPAPPTQDSGNSGMPLAGHPLTRVPPTPAAPLLASLGRGTTAPAALHLVPPTRTTPNTLDHDSGSAEAMLASPAPARLPLLLAAIALALVGAALAQVWLGRTVG